MLSAYYGPSKRLALILCAWAVLVLAPLVATKLPLDTGGNDKAQYLDFMRTMGASGVGHFLKVQPEIISFATIYCAWLFFGPTDVAFLFIFVVSFSLMLLVVVKIEHKAVPVFLLLFLSSSAFYASYGNVIRQAMAFPLLFSLVAIRRKGLLLLCVVTAGLVHIPSLVIGIPFLMCRVLGRWAAWGVAALAALFFFISRYHAPILSMFSGGDGYISKKINIYTSWDVYSVTTVALVAGLIATLNNFLWMCVRKQDLSRFGATRRAVIYWLLVLSNISFMGMMATSSLPKVFERIYIYFFVASILYLSISLIRVHSRSARVAVSLIIVVYAAFGIGKNLWVQNLLYAGNPENYLVENMLELYDFLL